MSDKLYDERDAMALDDAGNYYSRHVSAMTAESLHSKSAIAGELGHRDMLIDLFKGQRDELLARCDRLVKFVEAIAGTCEELSNDQLANLRGGALGIAHSARKNLAKVVNGADPSAGEEV